MEEEEQPTAPLIQLAILDDYQQVWDRYTKWDSVSDEVDKLIFRQEIPPERTIEMLEPFTIIHAMRERTKFTREVLKNLPNLEFITTTAMVNRGIDLEAAKEFGIVVSGTDSAPGSPGTTEQTWALILALTRRILPEYESVTKGGWQTGVAFGLSGRTLGLIGLGRLGQSVSRVALAFGMKVTAWSPHLTKEKAQEAGVEFAGSLENLLKTADVVSMHMVLGPTTKGLIGEKELRMMKNTAFIINTSRGPLIDEEALIKAIEEKWIAGAGLDVFEQEPLSYYHKIRTLKNVVLSPHMGYVDELSYKMWWPQTVENIRAFLDGKPIRVMT